MKRASRAGWVNGLLVVSEFCLLLWLEHRRPLRRSVEPKLRRSARNFALAALSAVALQVTETDSNWSSGLTLWDWLHGTLQLNVPQQAIIIGVGKVRM